MSDTSLAATLDLDEKPFVKSADKAVKALDKVNKKSKETSDILGKLQGYAAKYFAAEKVLDFGKALTDTSGKFEKFGSILTNALQSGSGAKDQLRNLTNFAAETPNQLDELTGSFIKFVNRGLIPSKQQLTNFGDLAASQGKGFDQLTEAILDAQSGEFERLKEFGVRASKSGNQVTLSFKGVSKTVKATSGDITQAIQKFGQLTGVAGSMSAVAQTQEGMVSNLGDSYDRLLVALGDAGVSGAYKGAIGIASEFLTTITDLIANSPVDDLRNQKSEINGLVGAIALANNNETVRLSLIQKLNQKYPEFLGKLDAESVTTDLLAKRLANVNDQYEKKIRIALGEEKIKKNADALTASIRQQQSAFEMLAKASGKSVFELEKLSPAQRIDLAKQVADQGKTSFRPSYFGQSLPQATDNLPNILASATARQKQLEDERSKLLGENAVRESDLIKTTVSGYDAQIKQVKEKIRLHQIDATIGEAEIKRLRDASRTAQGIASQKDNTSISGAAAAIKGDLNPALTTNEQILKRTTRELKEHGARIIKLAGGGTTTLKEQVALLQQLVKAERELADIKPVDLGDKAKPLTPKIVTGSAPPALPYLNEFLKKTKEDVDQANAYFDIAKEQLAHRAIGMLSGIGEAIGSGGDPLKTALQGILNFLGDFLIQMGEAMILGGQFMEIAMAAAPFMAPILGLQGASALIAGAGLVVGGGVVKGFGGSLEGGGLATGRSLVEVGESNKALRGGGEFIAPVALGADLISQRIMKNMGGVQRSAPSINDRTEIFGREILSGLGNGGGTLTARVEGSALLFVLEQATKKVKDWGVDNMNQLYTKEEACVLTVQGFIHYFNQQYRSSQEVTQERAYEKTEAIHLTILGARKYGDFSSFMRVVRRQQKRSQSQLRIN